NSTAPLLLDARPTGNTIQGNRIGVNASGAQLANGGQGINLQGSSANLIGGTASGAGNLISGNAASGVEISGATSAGNLLQGNLIGTNSGDSGAIANTTDGVLITNGASFNTLGGGTGGAGNVISGNTAIGVEISGGGTSSNLIAGNFIGTEAGGEVGLGNGGGVVIHAGSTYNVIGTDGDGLNDAAEANVISGNGGGPIPGISGGTYDN